jgi:hypothetical protein
MAISTRANLKIIKDKEKVHMLIIILDGTKDNLIMTLNKAKESKFFIKKHLSKAIF